ncbi:MAG TPA: hypothetical protein VF755_10380 [Catenuloplanes sp.]|jgi:hypothetical protein
MRWNRKRVLPELCGELLQAVQNRDGSAFSATYQAVVEQAAVADRAELTAALRVITPGLADVRLGPGAPVAVLAGGLVERGAEPAVALDTLVSRIAGGLEDAARFPALWDKVGDGAALPAAADADRVPAVLDRLHAGAHPDGSQPADAGRIAEAWFTVGDWVPALLVLLQRADVRQSLPHRHRLVDAAAATLDHIDPAQWMYGLLQVLDDESVIVLHRATGRGYRVTIGGIGDNFQLHTLLAATLIGDPDQGLIPGTPPQPAWVAAATDGEMEPPGGITGQFNLVDAFGSWIWNEGRPADIPTLQGKRVVVVDPPPYPRTWNAGRVYPLMRPTVTLDEVLEPARAAEWMARVAPAAQPG